MIWQGRAAYCPCCCCWLWGLPVARLRVTQVLCPENLPAFPPKCSWVPHKDATLTVNGTMKLKKEECMQISFLMPILRTEVARMEVTPDEILLVDRMGKRYVRATRKELKDVLPKKADFAHLEKLLYAASKPNGKKVLTGKELGIPSLEKGKIELSNFSDKPFALTPTQLSQKYKEVELEELLEMLMDL